MSSHTEQLHEKYLGYLLIQQQKKGKKEESKKGNGEEKGKFFLRADCLLKLVNRMIKS